jgi:uncharacterized membrane protein YhaH (DUF805 family)
MLAGEHPALRSLLGLASPTEEPPPEVPEPPARSPWPAPTSDAQSPLRVPLAYAPVVRARTELPVQPEYRRTARSDPENAWYWMTLALRNYADFQGRARRKEYWTFTLLVTLATVLAVMLGGAESRVGGLLLLVIVLGGVIPGLAVTVRRLHDLGLSGWLVLVGLIPYIGSLVRFILMLLDGKRGTNQYGPNPKEPVDASVFE